MRTPRKLFALLGVAALAMAACGGGDGDTAESTTTGAPAPTAAPATTVAAATTVSVATTVAPASGEPVTIALLAPLTGPVAQTAKQVENVVKMAADEYNLVGGVGGRPVEIKVYDTELKPEVAAQQAQRAIDQDGVTAIIGPWSTSEALAVAEVTERTGTVNINFSAATPSITAGKKYVFRTSPLTPDLGAGMVQVAQALGAKSVALMYDSGGFGLGAQPVIEGAASKAGLPLTGVQYTINATSVQAEVQKAASAKPEAVLIAGSAGADYGLIAKAMVEQGLDVPLIGFSPIVLPDAISTSAGAYDTLPGVYTLQTADTTKDLYKSLLERYNKKFDPIKNIPEQMLGSFDALWWLVDGLNESDLEGGDPLVAALESLPAREGANGRAGSKQQFGPGKRDALSGNYLVPYRLVNGQPQQDTTLTLD